MAGPISRLASPLKRYLDVRVEEHVTARIDALTSQIEDVRMTAVDTRRIVTDDLDASNEAAALIGRQLAQLIDAVERLRADVASLRA